MSDDGSDIPTRRRRSEAKVILAIGERRMTGDRGDNVRAGGITADAEPSRGGTGTKRGRWRERIATVRGTSRAYYNPTHQISQAISTALNPDVVLAQAPTTTRVEGSGAPIVVVRAVLLEESDRAVRVRVYAWVGWLPKAWCEWRSEGVLVINADHLKKKFGLARAIRVHAEMRQRLTAMRGPNKLR